MTPAFATSSPALKMDHSVNMARVDAAPTRAVKGACFARVRCGKKASCSIELARAPSFRGVRLAMGRLLHAAAFALASRSLRHAAPLAPRRLAPRASLAEPVAEAAPSVDVDGALAELASANARLRDENAALLARLAKTDVYLRELDDVEAGDWCELDLDAEGGLAAAAECADEPAGEFYGALQARASWLVGLLVLQSCSSFILEGSDALLSTHPSIVYFLTMLVGAGGNAGNQSAVRVIRGLALGTVNDDTRAAFVVRELKMAVGIALVMLVFGSLRLAASNVAPVDAFAIALALTIIVFLSVVAGAVLPLALDALRVDAAHASTTIQVVMDISGVLITTTVASALMIQTDIASKIVGALGVA